jgi:hypothetical protein
MLVFGTLILLSGCDLLQLQENSTPVLARVEGEYLFQSDLKGVVPEGLPYSDSVALVKKYVNNWVKNKLMLAQAEKNLTESQMDFDKQLNDYRSSLVIYRYESLLIDQELDTVVSDEEIQQYYQSHVYDFELKENILRAYYVVLESENELLDSISDVFVLPDTLAIYSLQDFENFVDFITLSTDTNLWMSFVQFQQIIPVESYNHDLFLQNNRYIELEEDGVSYMARILDFKIKDDISPLEVERTNIEQIIINKRKTKLIKKVREDIYNKALYNGDFEVY